MTRRRVATVLVIVLAAAIAVPVWRLRPAGRTLVAHFARAIGIYAGSDVRVLGVRVGRVASVEPEGGSVRVVMRYDKELRIPADATAVIVPPSIVSDRYVQLTPAYAGGAALADGADLPLARTVTPMEIDDVYRALDEFNRALGPDGANAEGALSRLIETGRANLEGNGENLNVTLDSLSRALSTLADGREDLFATVGNLQRLTTALAESDQQVRVFNQQLADVAEQLAAERDELAAALRSLAGALGDVTSFIKQNRAALVSNVEALADLTGVLVRQQRAIIEVLDIAPLALSNLNLAYNPRSGTLDTRDDALGPYDPASYVCSVLADAVPIGSLPAECAALAQTLSGKLPAVPGGTPPSAGETPGSTPPVPVPSLPQLPANVAGTVDRTLGGILKAVAP
jgi:phospholipid/cholesterol/gamma-HCH transport system substrate-binding protein